MTFSAGTVLQQRYEIVQVIGRGGFGAVYEAKDLRLGHRVALKQLTLAGGQVQRAFEREARILAHLRHPALPKVSDYFVDRSGYFLVMEFIPGDDFRSLLRQQSGPFAVAQVLAWMDELLDVLDYLHNQQPPVIHRDIKPANIKLTPPSARAAKAELARRGRTGQIVLLDFGISKGGPLGTTRQTLANSSIIAFSLNYASLEQIEGPSTDARSDLYSLGVTMYHLLTGHLPPNAVTRNQAQLIQQPDPLRPVNELNPLVPAQLAQLLADATNLDPNQRPASAEAMRVRLNALSWATRPHSATQQQSNTATATTATIAPSQRIRWVLAGVAGMLLVLIVVGLASTLISDDGGAHMAQATSSASATTVATVTNSPAATEIAAEIPATPFVPVLEGTPVPAGAPISPANAAQVMEVARWGLISEIVVNGVAISPDGTTLASGSNQNVLLRRISDGQLINRLAGHTDMVRSVAISSDGTTLASGSDDRTIRLWQLSDGSLINILEGHKNYVYSVAISPDSTILASGSRDNTVRLWGISDGALLNTLTGHTDRVNSVTISPDGSTVASSSRDSTVRRWGISDGQLINTFTQPQNSIWSVAISRDGQTLALGADEKLQWWRISDALRILSLKGHTDVIWSVAISPDGTIIASGSADNSVRLWRVSDGALLKRLDGHTDNVYSVAISADGTTLASGSADGTVRLWRVVQE